MENIILLVSLAGIVFGADYLVAGAVSVARRFKVSDFVIGAAIVGVGTSMPELVVSFIGAFMFLCFIAYNYYLITSQIA